MDLLGLTISRSARPRRDLPVQGIALVIGTAALTVCAGGTAWAVWSTSGAGTGAAASGSAQGLLLSGGTVNGNVLYPGAAGDVVVTISNPNTFPVAVTSLALPATAGSSYTDAGLTTANTACNASTGVAWAYATKSLSGVVVAAKSGSTNGTLTLTLTGGASMTNASDNACQASYFKLPNVTSVTAASSAAAPVATVTQ